MLQETHHIITAPHGVEVYGLGKEPLGEYLYSSVHVVLEKSFYQRSSGGRCSFSPLLETLIRVSTSQAAVPEFTFLAIS